VLISAALTAPGNVRQVPLDSTWYPIRRSERWPGQWVVGVRCAVLFANFPQQRLGSAARDRAREGIESSDTLRIDTGGTNDVDVPDSRKGDGMNAFEELVAGLLRREGYWTHQSYKVVLSKQDKVSIGKPSLPRIEIDILGYKASSNTLLWVECKSYLDSSGVSLSNFDAENGRYKVFANKELRSVATKQLISQATKSGLARGHPKVEYWLVAGHIARESRQGLQKRFDSEGWILLTDEWIANHLKAMAGDAYEDDVAMIVAKLSRTV
jgi:hypothetical protein